MTMEWSLKHVPVDTGSALIVNRFEIHTPRGVRFTVDIASNDYYFTVYDNYEEPVATVSRPRHDGKDGMQGRWRVSNARGERIAEHTSGPRACMRSFAIWHFGVLEHVGA